MPPTPQPCKRRTECSTEAAIDLTTEEVEVPRKAAKHHRRTQSAATSKAAGIETVDLTEDSPAANRAGEPSHGKVSKNPAAANWQKSPTLQQTPSDRCSKQKAAAAAAARVEAAPAAAASQLLAKAVLCREQAQPGSMFRSRHDHKGQPAELACEQEPTQAQPSCTSGRSNSAEELPAWHNMQGAKRLQAELRYLLSAIEAGKLPCVHDLTPVNDNIFKWRFQLKNFDNDCEGGRGLNEDLSVLQAVHGQDHLLLEATFPRDYPHAPFFLRLITPRCVWYTGHVTAGGAICIEVLTQSGTPNSWRSSMCVESIINTVLLNMLHCESIMVQTATGPGGRSGPLRIDLQRSYSWNVMQPYSEHEAQSAFNRMLSHHRANGW